MIQLRENEFQTKDEWLEVLSQEIALKSQLVPIIILTSPGEDKLIMRKMKNQQKANVRITSLIDKNPYEINASLE